MAGRSARAVVVVAEEATTERKPLLSALFPPQASPEPFALLGRLHTNSNLNASRRVSHPCILACLLCESYEIERSVSHHDSGSSVHAEQRREKSYWGRTTRAYKGGIVGVCGGVFHPTERTKRGEVKLAAVVLHGRIGVGEGDSRWYVEFTKTNEPVENKVGKRAGEVSRGRTRVAQCGVGVKGRSRHRRGSGGIEGAGTCVLEKLGVEGIEF